MDEPDSSAKETGAAEPARFASLGQAVGHTRFVVLIAVGAVLAVAISLFVLGTVQAVITVWNAWLGPFKETSLPTCRSTSSRSSS